MENQERNIPQSPAKNSSKFLLRAHILIRIATIGSAFSALCVTISSKQSVTLYGMLLDARYSYDESLKFYAYANGIVCGFSVISLIFAVVITRHRSSPANHFILFLHDLCMMSLELSGCAAATAIGYLAKYGNSHTGWMQICDQFGKYCNKLTIGLALGYLTFVLFLMLTVISANKLRQS